MEDLYAWIIIILLIAIITRLNQGNKKLSQKEIEKMKKDTWKIIWWIVGISIGILILINFI